MPAPVIRTSPQESGLSPQLEKEREAQELKDRSQVSQLVGRCSYSGILPRARETPKIPSLGKATVKGQRTRARWSRRTTRKGRISCSNTNRNQRKGERPERTRWFAQEASVLTQTGKDHSEGPLQPGAYLRSQHSESKSRCLGTGGCGSLGG